MSEQGEVARCATLKPSLKERRNKQTHNRQLEFRVQLGDLCMNVGKNTVYGEENPSPDD